MKKPTSGKVGATTAVSIPALPFVVITEDGRHLEGVGALGHVAMCRDAVKAELDALDARMVELFERNDQAARREYRKLTETRRLLVHMLHVLKGFLALAERIA